MRREFCIDQLPKKITMQESRERYFYDAINKQRSEMSDELMENQFRNLVMQSAGTFVKQFAVACIGKY